MSRAPRACAIIGATGGIGSWVARSLCEAGGGVFLAARSEAQLKDLRNSLNAPCCACDARAAEPSAQCTAQEKIV